MSYLEDIIMEEITSLDELRLIDVIGFIRYLKSEKPIKEELIAGWFENILQEIHEQRDKLGLTEEVFEAISKKKPKRG